MTAHRLIKKLVGHFSLKGEIPTSAKIYSARVLNRSAELFTCEAIHLKLLT